MIYPMLLDELEMPNQVPSAYGRIGEYINFLNFINPTRSFMVPDTPVVEAFILGADCIEKGPKP